MSTGKTQITQLPINFYNNLVFKATLSLNTIKRRYIKTNILNNELKSTTTTEICNKISFKKQVEYINQCVTLKVSTVRE